jgi:hypothetical protein
MDIILTLFICYVDIWARAFINPIVGPCRLCMAMSMFSCEKKKFSLTSTHTKSSENQAYARSEEINVTLVLHGYCTSLNYNNKALQMIMSSRDLILRRWNKKYSSEKNERVSEFKTEISEKNDELMNGGRTSRMVRNQSKRKWENT